MHERATPGEMMIRRLSGRTVLPSLVEQSLRQAAGEIVRDIAARRDVVREGDRPVRAVLLGTGWACRYKLLEDGRRQILEFIMPGDFCGVGQERCDRSDHSIGAITDIQVARIDFQSLRDLSERYDALAAAFRWNSTTMLARQRTLAVSLGQRTALERIAHLICELYARLAAVRLADANVLAFPLTQADLADATGLTSVHVNRMLQELRRSGLIVSERRSIRIPDLGALQRLAMFDAGYLQLGQDDAVAGARAPESTA